MFIVQPPPLFLFLCGFVLFSLACLFLTAGFLGAQTRELGRGGLDVVVWLRFPFHIVLPRMGQVHFSGESGEVSV